MIVFDSRKVRYVVGRLEAGERVHDALRTIAEEHGIATAWVTGLGAFRWLELAEYDQDAQVYRPSKRIDTPCEILTLTGNLSFKDGAPFAHVHATVSREVGDGIEVLGGHLVDGEVFACELRLEVFDDLLLDRARDDETGLALWTEGPPPTPARAAQAPSTRSDGAVSWASVAQASMEPEPPPRARPERRGRTPSRTVSSGRVPDLAFVTGPLPEKRRADADALLDEPLPERGDWVDHKVFGLCRVDGEDAEGSLIIRLPSGARKPIRLDFLEVLPPRHEGDRRIFPLRPRQK
jgi:uncharacterized protein